MVVVRNGEVAFGAIALLLLPTLLGFTAPSSPSTGKSAGPLISIRFPPSPGGNGPGRTASSGTRSPSCSSCIENAMTVLMPLDRIVATVAAEPSLLVYLPQATARFAKVAVVEENSERQVYVKDFRLPATLEETRGIVRLKLEGANLKAGKPYRWTLSAIASCDEEESGAGNEVWGIFQRQERNAELKQQLEGATPLEQAQLYAQARIWNETLAIAASLRASNPDEWTELLQSVELEAIASAPFLD